MCDKIPKSCIKLMGHFILSNKWIIVFPFLIFAQISPEIHGLVVFLGDKALVRIGQHNLKALLIQSNKSCVASLLLLLLLSSKKIGNARPGEGDWHPISPKTPAPHYQHIEEKKRKGK